MLYLHGVGDDGTDRRWWDLLRRERGLAGRDLQIISPDYAHLLLGPGESRPWPPRTRPLGHDDSQRQERAFHIRQADLAVELQRRGTRLAAPDDYAGFGRVPDPIDAFGERIIMSTIYDVVTRYVGDRPRRLAVLDRVLDHVRPHAEIVIVAHSLGALVALDLIQHLPPGLRVRLLVTAASAIARRALPDEVLSLRHNFPHDRVGQWVNVYNPRDAVTRGRGIARRFPDAVDVAVPSGLGDHELATLMSDSGIRGTVAWAVDHSVFDETMAAPSPGTGIITGPLSLEVARDLSTVAMLGHCETVARRSLVPESTLGRIAAARRLRLGRVQRLLPAPVALDAVTPLLRHALAAADVPDVLAHLATVRPFDPIRVRLPRPLLKQARAATALDVGAPPTWFHEAREKAERGWLLTRWGRPPGVATPH